MVGLILVVKEATHGQAEVIRLSRIPIQCSPNIVGNVIISVDDDTVPRVGDHFDLGNHLGE